MRTRKTDLIGVIHNNSVEVVQFSTGKNLGDAVSVAVPRIEHVIEVRDLRGVPLAEAIEVVVDARATRQQAEVQEAVAILHIVQNYHRDLPGNPMPGRGRLVELAAEGGPLLNEFVPLELAAALGVSQQSITLLICDLLDLEYRHPVLWRQVREGATPLWQARKIAQRVAAAGLGVEAAMEVDRQLSPILPGVTPGRALRLLEGLIVAVDPRGAELRAETERCKRWVRIQPTTDGVSWLDGKLTGADGKQLDGTLNRIAAALKADGNTDDRDARRSSALGILSNPALALAVLHRNQQRHTGENTDRDAAPASDLLAGVPDSLLEQLATIDPKKLLPKSTLFVHVSDRSIRTGRGAARVEGASGPSPSHSSATCSKAPGSASSPCSTPAACHRSTPTKSRHPCAAPCSCGTRPTPSPTAPGPAATSTSTTPTPGATTTPPPKPPSRVCNPSSAADTAPKPTASGTSSETHEADTSGEAPSASPTESSPTAAPTG